MSEAARQYPNPSTFAVYEWPEFKAFMSRLGVSTERVYDMHIHLPYEGIVSVSLEQQATDTTCERSPFQPPPEQPAKGL